MQDETNDVMKHDECATDASSSNWQEIDRNLTRIARQRSALDADEARWLVAAVRGEIWRELGAVTLLEYLEDRLGYGPRTAHERVRVALALDELPGLIGALDGGALPFTAVRELVRVATPATEAVWCDYARGKTVRQIEEAVSGRERGDLPSDPPRPDVQMRILRFEVRPETFAKVRQAQRVLEHEQGARLDDDALVAALCNAVLGGDQTRAQHQIMTIECERCGQGWQGAAGDRFAIGRAALERARCDAERIDPASMMSTQDVPPRVRRFVHQRDGEHCCVPGCRSSRYLEMHHIVPRASGGDHTPDNLTLLCDGHHRAVHDGWLSIAGAAPKLSFEWSRSTHVGQKAERALVELGYPVADARSAVIGAMEELGDGASLEHVISEARTRSGM